MTTASNKSNSLERRANLEKTIKKSTKAIIQKPSKTTSNNNTNNTHKPIAVSSLKKDTLEKTFVDRYVRSLNLNQNAFDKGLRQIKVENRKQAILQRENNNNSSNRHGYGGNASAANTNVAQLLTMNQKSKILSRLCTKTFLWNVAKMFDDEEKRFLIESVGEVERSKSASKEATATTTTDKKSQEKSSESNETLALE